MGIFIIILSALFFYFLPTIIAASKKKKNANAVFVLNLFLGWTLIGWVVALVWAVSHEAEQLVASSSQNKTEELEKLATLKEKGVISESEFATQKKRVLES